MAVILKPIYVVEELGEYSQLPDGAIINIGGTSGPGFLVDGKPLMFADGTSTDGSPVSNLPVDFQTVYQNSVGTAFIDFTSGKDFILEAVNNNRFIFDADTGLVTITGDLKVEGTTTSIINTEVVSDKVWIHQRAGDYIPFLMEPRSGVTPQVNVVDIKVLNGGPSVFYIGPDGRTHIQDLITGTINGIDVTALYEAFTEHANLESEGIKHKASQISVEQPLEGIDGENVQEALESISSTLVQLTNAVGGVRGYEHKQLVAVAEWTIAHEADTEKIQVTIWDADNEMLLPDSVKIVDVNTVKIVFNTPVTGRAILMLF